VLDRNLAKRVDATQVDPFADVRTGGDFGGGKAKKSREADLEELPPMACRCV
jgi:hypothetical protein